MFLSPGLWDMFNKKGLSKYVIYVFLYLIACIFDWQQCAAFLILIGNCHLHLLIIFSCFLLSGQLLLA